MDKPQGLILLTYKGKVLLMHKQDGVLDNKRHPWCLIEGARSKTEPFEKTLIKHVQKEMGIKINNIETVTDSYFHARLTDDNVNSIKRSENQLLDFFSPKEVKKLFLSVKTADFISNHESLITL
ncbi:MAG: hypothetical protein AAB778_02235 [Patescibacteria group bacterium]